jgi:hypothetical protein
VIERTYEAHYKNIVSNERIVSTYDALERELRRPS